MKLIFCGGMQTRSKPTDTEIISAGDIHDEKRATVTQHCLAKRGKLGFTIFEVPVTLTSMPPFSSI